MPQVKLDRIDTLSIKEQYGVMVGMEREAVVTGLTGLSWEKMLEALDEAGVPQKNTYLRPSPEMPVSGKGYNLVVIGREVTMADKDKATVKIIYGENNDKGQALFWEENGIVRNMKGRMSASVVQKETNRMPTGEPIIVSHTYPDDDPDYAGQVVIQTGMINVMAIQRNFKVQGIKNLVAPWTLAEALIGRVNAKVWLGQRPRTWMCVDVSWEYRDFGNYFMEFEFQCDFDTWDPTVIFIDDRTGRPPQNLSETGIRQIEYHAAADFVSLLGFRVIGPAQ